MRDLRVREMEWNETWSERWNRKLRARDGIRDLE